MLGFVWVLMMGSCKKETPEIGDPFSKLEGINDSFQLSEVKQQDLVTKLDRKEIDLSAMFIGQIKPVISFNSENFTWTYQEGDSPNYFGNSGTWSFGNDSFPDQANEYPEYILMNNGSEEYRLLLGHTIRIVEQDLTVVLLKGCLGDGGNFAYQFKFDRI